MANMSYCRFRNTKIDLEDCVEALECEWLSQLSEDEKYAADKMYELAQRYIEAYYETIKVE